MGVIDRQAVDGLLERLEIDADAARNRARVARWKVDAYDFGDHFAAHLDCETQAALFEQEAARYRREHDSLRALIDAAETAGLFR